MHLRPAALEVSWSGDRLSVVQIQIKAFAYNVHHVTVYDVTVYVAPPTLYTPRLYLLSIL